MITLLEDIESVLRRSLANLDPSLNFAIALVEPASYTASPRRFGLSHAVRVLISQPRPMVITSLFARQAFQTPPNIKAEDFSDLLDEEFVTLLRLPATQEHLRECVRAMTAKTAPTEDQIHRYRHRWINFWYSEFDSEVLHRLTSQLLGLHTAPPGGELTEEEVQNIIRARATVSEFRAQLDNDFLEMAFLLDQAKLKLESVLENPNDFPAAQDALFEFHQIRGDIAKQARRPLSDTEQ